MVPPARMTARAEETIESKWMAGLRSWNLRVMSVSCLRKKSWPSDVGWVRARRRDVRVCRIGVDLGGSLDLDEEIRVCCWGCDVRIWSV